MTYPQAEHNLKKLEKFGIKPGLQRIRALMHLAGDPHTRLKVIHVAGTNGKGSVCAMLDSCLRAAGLTCGLYTSPHLVDLRERFQFQGRMISRQEFAQAFAQLKPALEAMRQSTLGLPTFFEATTALALCFFARRKPDVVVLETGLGGRFDATNIFPHPLLTIVTNVDLEHTDILGKSLEKIAWEKAGIAKAGATLATFARNPALKVIRKLWQEAQGFGSGRPGPWPRFLDLINDGNWLARAKKYDLPLLGSHQQENLACVLAGLDALKGKGFKINVSAIRQGLARVKWPGRLQLVSESPRIWLDGAHNPAGARALAQSLPGLRRGRLGLVMGVLKDKDWKGILAPLAGLSDFMFLSAPRNQRALNPAQMLPFVRGLGVQAKVFPSLKSALSAARAWAGEGDTLVAAGSLYSVGEILGLKTVVSCRNTYK